jgi:hypothetical protein
VQHKVATIDAQPSNPAVASIIVSVTGALLVRLDCGLRCFVSQSSSWQVDENTNPLQFSQTFHLIPDGQSYYV